MTVHQLLLGLVGALLLGMIWFDERGWKQLAALPDAARVDCGGLDHTGWLLFPILAAVAAVELATRLGHRGLGLRIALAVLVLNSTVLMVLRIRTFAPVPRSARRGLVNAQLATFACSIGMWIAAAAYLFRWV